ncbi:ABC transporter ATP-binding protein [sulfur-oxidizing endosymbiont of Gigantopelta aegis]|uniref:ABC transporter ATP-binding protein n=1 Tax=sulfur-oxidizing endosymbiont of Gigantopelta aegis TaxID=2794934 RepID=UPI0018DE08C2|nr:ATP-binding cassette domain-containing protein [sulfur-oxidizing endosymbiont of Gigantopelta aegis]
MPALNTPTDSDNSHNEILIEVNQLSRHFSNTNKNNAAIIAVDAISFNLHRGEVLGFLGPNGAGKSTTMQMLTGNLAPTHGQIKIAGMDLMDKPIEAKAKIGYLPDTPPLYKELSVDEYLKYCAQLNQVAKPQISAALAMAKERCGLTKHGQRVINNLSKGYQQRVGIAQAIIHSPDIVILDEPTVGLDPIQMVEIRKLIKDLGKTHSVMLSSHILPEIQAICDHVQIINQGKLVFNASIAQLNQHMQTQTLQMRCSNPVDIAKITALDSIIKVEQQGNIFTLDCAFPSSTETRAEISTESSTENQNAIIHTSQQLVALAQQEQWGLYELYPQKQTLEDIFMSLTGVDKSLQANNKSSQVPSSDISSDALSGAAP